jgi:hypothetical protein
MDESPVSLTGVEIARQLEEIQARLAILAAGWNHDRVADELTTIRGHLHDLARDNAREIERLGPSDL